MARTPRQAFLACGHQVRALNGHVPSEAEPSSEGDASMVEATLVREAFEGSDIDMAEVSVSSEGIRVSVLTNLSSHLPHLLTHTTEESKDDPWVPPAPADVPPTAARSKRVAFKRPAARAVPLPIWQNSRPKTHAASRSSSLGSTSDCFSPTSKHTMAATASPTDRHAAGHDDFAACLRRDLGELKSSHHPTSPPSAHGSTFPAAARAALAEAPPDDEARRAFAMPMSPMSSVAPSRSLSAPSLHCPTPPTPPPSAPGSVVPSNTFRSERNSSPAEEARRSGGGSEGSGSSSDNSIV